MCRVERDCAFVALKSANTCCVGTAAKGEETEKSARKRTYARLHKDELLIVVFFKLLTAQVLTHFISCRYLPEFRSAGSRCP